MKKLYCSILALAYCGILNAGCCSGSGCCNPPTQKDARCCSGSECCTPPTAKVQEETTDYKEIIKQEYGKVAEGSSSSIPGASCCATVGGCCGGGGDLSNYLGYSDEELRNIPDANLGLGCGHPVSLGEINQGDTILDLGSGAGIDCFIAAKMVGPTGTVIGVDMTEAMIKKARSNATKYGFENVEFRLGYIENLPVASNSVDIIISNCVINLSENKPAVFQEANRALRTGGRMFISDVVLLGPLSPEQTRDPELICACVGGALPKEEYIAALEQTGFEVEIVGEDREICQKWFGHDDLPIASLKFIAHKK
ncbi:arsenite methyltransferase [Candidatus Dependentiae bacterium]